MSAYFFDTKVKSFLAGFFMVSIFIVHIKILPLEAETQPILSLAVALALFSLASKRYFSSVDFIFLSLFFLYLSLLTVIIFFLRGGAGAFVLLFKYTMGPVFFMAVIMIAKNIRPAYLFFVVLVFVLLAMLYVVDSSTEILINEVLTGRVNTHGRPNFFTPEPSYFVYLYAPVICLSYFFHLKGSLNGKMFFLLTTSVTMCGLLTVSSYQYVFLALFSTSLFFLFSWKGRLGLAVVLLFIVIVLLTFSNAINRLSSLFSVMYLYFYGDIGWDFIVYKMDPSASTRVLINYIAFSSGFENLGFGSLGVGFSDYWASRAVHLGINIEAHEVLRSVSISEPQTYLSNLIYDYGLFPTVLVILFFGYTFFIACRHGKYAYSRRQKRTFNAFMIFSLGAIFFLLFFQGAVSSPALWVILGLVRSSKNIFFNERFV